MMIKELLLLLCATAISSPLLSKEVPAPTAPIPHVEIKRAGEGESLVNGGFESGLTGWTGDSIGAVIPATDTFWGGRLYYADGASFFCGFANEGGTGTLTSSNFVLGGEGYVSLLIGGGLSKTNTYVRLVDVTEGNIEILRITSDYFSDPNKTLNLHFQWGKADSQYLGDTVRVEIVDNATGGFGALDLDNIVVSQTASEVYSAFATFKARIGTNSDASAHGTRDTFSDIGFPFTGVSANLITNGDFETGDLTGWTQTSGTTINADPVINDSHFWAEDIPYNNHGVSHFNGWATGVAESAAYSIRSTTFTLGGSGYITWRMGGHSAALKVFTSTGTELGVFGNTAFADINFPYVENGCRLATMTTFVADLSAFIGESLYIELCDLGDLGGWSNAYFDNVVTFYQDIPQVATSYDTVTQVWNNPPTLETDPHINNLDIHIGYASGTNTSVAGEPASDFIQYFRGLRVDGSICYMVTNMTTYDAMLSQYNALSAASKAIVDSTKDIIGQSFTISETMQFLSSRVGSRPLESVSGANNDYKSGTQFMIMLALIGAALFTTFMVLTKREKRA